MSKKETSINSILGKDSEFIGEFITKGSARVDGSVNGNVKVSGLLIVGVSGYINGNVEAHDALIGGEVLGNITTEGKTELSSTARVLGDINNKTIVIDENAIFQGKCNMNQDLSDAKRRKTATSKAIRMGKRSAKDAIAEALKEVEEDEKLETMESTGIPKFPSEIEI